jgi:hypothetical protein
MRLGFTEGELNVTEVNKHESQDMLITTRKSQKLHTFIGGGIMFQ